MNLFDKYEMPSREDIDFNPNFKDLQSRWTWQSFVPKGMQENWNSLTNREKLIIMQLCEKMATDSLSSHVDACR